MKSLSELICLNVLPGGDLHAAQTLSNAHNLNLFENVDEAEIAMPYVLSFSESASKVIPLGKGSSGPVSASFLEGKTLHRLKFGGGKGQLIAKAVGIQAGIYPKVLDATAGLGKDAFVLATLGCEVSMLERSPIVAQLLRSAILEARDTELTDIVERLSLLECASNQWLSLQEGMVADVIYLDPMYPHRDKSALVKKEMRVFRDLVGEDLDASDLLEQALPKAEYRVVVKRPRKGDKIAGPEPTYQLNGKTSRYDVYVNKSINELKGR